MEPPTTPAPPQLPLSPPPLTTEKPAHNRQKDRDFLLHLEAYLAKRDGVDKLLKISRYTAKLLLSMEAAAPSPRLKSFESSVGLSRKAFRLGKFVQDVNALRFSRPTDRQSLILSLVAYLGEGTYYFVEQFVWLSKSGLIDKRHLSYLQKMSAWAELIGYVGSLGLKIRDLTELTEEEGKLARSLEVGLTRGDACREEEARLKKVREKTALKRLSVVQDLADAIMALADVSDGKRSLAAPPAVISSAGLISALISAHKNWAGHVFFLLCQFVNHLEVIYLPVYYPSQEEKDDAKLYANNVRRLMAMEGKLIMSGIGLSEKRVYHAALNSNNSLPRVLHRKED